MSDIYLACDESSRFLCDESKDLCFDDLAAATVTGGSVSNGGGPIGGPHGSHPVDFRVPVWSDETFSRMLERECAYLPKEGYLLRLRSGELDLNFRREAFDWICKAHTHYCYGPLSLCLSMNYLDRFLSLYDLPRGKAWAVQLLAVACFSIAVKMEEVNVPQLIELQVGDPKFVFEAKTIERMELLVLSTLNWRMNALTPCCFVDYFLSKIYVGNPIPTEAINKSIQLILYTIRGLHFLEFKPSEVAAAVSICIDKAISTIHVQKDRVMKCLELIKDLSPMNNTGDGGRSYIPESPNGVLESGYLSSNTSDENITDGSQITKRRRLDHLTSGEDSSKS